MKKNILEYIKKYGSYTFKEKEFNEVDGLILCQLSYLKYEGLALDIKTKFTSIQSLLAYKTLPWTLPRRYRENKQIIELLLTSNRFKTIEMGYFRHILDNENEEQFAAITFRIARGFYYIAYRGTDSTIIGWKEDFNMSFSNLVFSQQHADEYLKMILHKFKGKYIIGGHSKGGNLAEYAYYKNSEAPIVRVDDYDGPGFIDENININKDKILKYVPKSSVVGILMDNSNDYFIVDSNAFGVEQHDPYAWIIQEDHFKLLEKRDALSNYVENTVNAWLDKVNRDERERLVNTIYDIIQESNVETTTDVKEDLLPFINTTFKKFNTIDEDTKTMIFDITKALISAGGEEIKNNFLDTINKIKENSIFNN